jgi:aquaporin Z
MTSSGTAPAPVQAYPLSTRVAIEGLGSFFIVFAGLGTALFNSTGSAATIGFAYGLAMAAAIVSFGHISNGYFNPAFSLGLAVAGRLKYSAMALYIVAQTIGAILASVVWLGMMKVMPAGATPETAALFGALANGFDAHSPSQVPLVGVLIVEVVAVAVLTAMVLGITSIRNKTTLGPVAIGVAFAVAVAITMPLSNGSLNPARATSVVFLAESWAAGQLWLFWLAPLVGAALAAAIYRAFVPAAAVADLTDDAETSSAVPAATVASEGEETDASAAEAPAAPVPASSINGDVAPVKSSAVDDAQAFFDGAKK